MISLRKHGLKVMWIEPIPEVFKALEANIVSFPRQRALQCLLTDRDDVDYQFHIADNAGKSSSLLDLHLHRHMFPQVSYEKTTKLRSKTLASLLQIEGIDPQDYDALVLDTQGSELLVLKGAAALLRHFCYIKLEVADFESYLGCCQLPDVESFLADLGFREISRNKFAECKHLGRYFDIVYKRIA